MAGLVGSPVYVEPVRPSGGAPSLGNCTDGSQPAVETASTGSPDLVIAPAGVSPGRTGNGRAHRRPGRQGERLSLPVESGTTTIMVPDQPLSGGTLVRADMVIKILDGSIVTTANLPRIVCGRFIPNCHWI